MTVRLAQRALKVQASPIRKLVPFADQAKVKGTQVFHLNIGQPDIETPGPVLDVLRNYEPRVIAYTHSQGQATLVEALVSYFRRWDIPLDAHDINVTTGGSEALLFAFLTALNPGDEVIIPEPFYTNYNGFATMAGVSVVPLTTHGSNGFHLPSVEDIEVKIGPKTRAILLCNPSNPTGAVYTRDEIDAVAKLAKAHNLWLMSDEVYREFVFEPKPDQYRSALQLEGMEDRVIVVDSVSKRFSMCGSRIGCIVSRNRELMEAVLRLGQARLSSPQIDQAMAQVAYEQPPATVDAMIDEYRRRRDVVFEALQEMEGVEVHQPEGAFYVLPRLPIQDSEHFAKWLLTDFSDNGQTVMVAPAAGFYATPGLGLDEIRIAYVLELDDLRRAMELLGLALQQYRDAFPG